MCVCVCVCVCTGLGYGAYGAFAILIWNVQAGKADVSATTTLGMPRLERMPRRIPQGNHRYFRRNRECVPCVSELASMSRGTHWSCRHQLTGVTFFTDSAELWSWAMRANHLKLLSCSTYTPCKSTYTTKLVGHPGCSQS